ncbi:hypothetical protein FSARC_11133 [Fusarium sarcochroum]|uniref:Uncharacterized protein n=1 Tax=Fusarium sarcochroum TaxID=1208366 RepID=A0A8H4THS1_9HYPO|nr:hypothetical protein FSARC_11133 [Fusarium sarcochroum]
MLFKTILATTVAAPSALATLLEASQTSSSYFTPSNTWQYSIRDGAITADQASLRFTRAPVTAAKTFQPL